MERSVVSGNAVVRFVKKLHSGEEGMETVQIIMILAIAAMVLTGVNSVAGFGGDGKESGSGIFDVVTKGLGSLFGGNGFGVGDIVGKFL